MRKNLQTAFSRRQYMLSRDFEIYYYDDCNLSEVGLHAHDYYEFYFFLEGDVSMQIGEDVFPIRYGDMVLIPPDLEHRPIIHSQSAPYRRFVFWISREYCDRLLELSPDYVYLMQYVQISKTYLFHNDRITFNGIQSRILRLIEEMRYSRFGRDAQIPLCVNELILHINRVIHAQNVPASKREETALSWNIAAYIEEHIDEDLSLEQLSGIFYVSKYYIAHVFKDSLGISIHQYITKKRLALCREAILGNANITEVCLSFGFKDYSSFYRAFKKEYGMSPKDYRDMQGINGLAGESGEMGK